MSKKDYLIMVKIGKIELRVEKKQEENEVEKEKWPLIGVENEKLSV